MNLTAKGQILIVNAHVHQGKSFMLRFSLFFWWPKLEVKFSLRLKSFTCAFSINVLKCSWGSPRPNTFPSPKGTSVEICFERERHILAASVFVCVAVCGLCFCVCMSGSWKLMMSSVFVYHTLPRFWGRVSHWAPELTNRSILSPKTFLSPGSSTLGSVVHTGVSGLLCGCWGTKHMLPK